MQVSKGQIQRIWGIAKKALQMSDDDLYTAVFEITGSESISKLQFSQAHRVILHLETLASRADRRARYADDKSSISRIQDFRPTEDQVAYLDDLISKINGGSQKLDLNGLCKRMFKKDRNNLNRKQTQALIEALKSILGRNVV